MQRDTLSSEWSRARAGKATEPDVCENGEEVGSYFFRTKRGTLGFGFIINHQQYATLPSELVGVYSPLVFKAAGRRSAIRQTISMRSIVAVEPRDDIRKFTFVLLPEDCDSPVYLCAKDERERNRWMFAIRPHLPKSQVPVHCGTDCFKWIADNPTVPSTERKQLREGIAAMELDQNCGSVMNERMVQEQTQVHYDQATLPKPNRRKGISVVADGKFCDNSSEERIERSPLSSASSFSASLASFARPPPTQFCPSGLSVSFTNLPHARSIVMCSLPTAYSFGSPSMLAAPTVGRTSISPFSTAPPTPHIPPPFLRRGSRTRPMPSGVPRACTLEASATDPHIIPASHVEAFAIEPQLAERGC